MIYKRNKFVNRTNVSLRMKNHTTCNITSTFYLYPCKYDTCLICSYSDDAARRNEALVLLINFISHGLIACTLLGINIFSKIEIPAWILARDNIEETNLFVR